VYNGGGGGKERQTEKSGRRSVSMLGSEQKGSDVVEREHSISLKGTCRKTVGEVGGEITLSECRQTSGAQWDLGTRGTKRWGTEEA